ncbi:MAG TPA: hypothetical protein VFP54_10580 [Acidimicrobiales bacterium]|nr:hypothetical protein [Acidimicrobiales bacterium]
MALLPRCVAHATYLIDERFAVPLALMFGQDAQLLDVSGVVDAVNQDVADGVVVSLQ